MCLALLWMTILATLSGVAAEAFADLVAAHASAGIRHVGDVEALRQLVARLRRGKPLRVVVVGGSISAFFGGAYGEGAQRRPMHLHVGHARGSATRRPSGFFVGFMESVNASFPHVGHALFNNAMGASNARLVVHCTRSFVPTDTDVVFVDYAVNQGRPQQYRDLMTRMRKVARPPVVVAVHNVRWCSSWCPTNVSRRDVAVYYATQTTDRLGHLERAAASCGAAVLSVFYALQPLLARGRLRPFEITRDGRHPAGWEVHGSKLSVAWDAVLRAFWQTVQRVGGAPDAAAELTPGAGEATAVAHPDERCAAKSKHLARHCYGADSMLPQPRFVTSPKGFHLAMEAENDANATTRRRKAGWLSTQVGSELVMGLEEWGHLRVSLWFLHSYANAGDIDVDCPQADVCSCPPLRHSCLWTRRVSTFEHVSVVVEARREAAPGACQLRIRHVAGPMVKLSAITVTVLPAGRPGERLAQGHPGAAAVDRLGAQATRGGGE